ncbi:MAG TPA: MFS transporter [Ktedonobacteraceae bacterium]
MYERRPANVYDKFETGGIGALAFAKGDVPANEQESALTAAEKQASGLERAPVLSVESAQEESQMNRWVVLALAASSSFITTLDGSIVNIGLPAISETFHVGVSGAIEWVIIGYLVIIAAVLLTFGRLADMLGRRPIFLSGLAIFVLGSALCGMAPSLWLLIVARLFQGLGGALIFSVNVAMITSAFYNRERGLALGLNAVVVSLGVALGPTIGGIITQYLSWRWIFYVNVPICLLVFFIGYIVYRERRPGAGENGRFDPPGAALLAIGFAALTLGLSFGSEWGWSSPGTLGAFGVGLVMLVSAVAVEKRIEHPILDLHLVTNRTFAMANITFMLCMMALFAPGFILPFYFEQLRGFSTVHTGLMMTPLPLALALAAPLSGSLADRVGSRLLSPIGLAVACLGLVLLSQLNAQSSTWDVVWRLALTGFGQGIFQSPNTRAMMGAAPRDAQGEASGLLATGRVIGQSTSVALTGTVFTALGAAAAGTLLTAPGARNLAPEHLLALQSTFVSGFHASLLVCALFAALGIFTAMARGVGGAPSRRGR